MAHYFFPKDLAESKIAVQLMMAHYRETLGAKDVVEFPKGQQIYGDFQSRTGVVITGHEVKYDIMAAKTSNLCFEISNAKGELTGVAKTLADLIHYVVPGSEKTSFTVFTFETEKLKSYIFDVANTKKVRQVQGGDGRKYTMLIVPIEHIINDNVAVQVEVLNAKLSL